MARHHEIDTEFTVLLDTNIIIAIEGDQDANHVNNRIASELHRLIQKVGGTVAVLKNIDYDLRRHLSDERTARRERQIIKYPSLSAITLSAEDYTRAGYSSDTAATSNHGVDASLLIALERNAATWLVTEDHGIHRHAQVLGVHERVLKLTDAYSLAKTLDGKIQDYAQRSELVEPHIFDLNDKFFFSLRERYKGFDEWWKRKVVGQRRPCLLVGFQNEIQGLAVIDLQNSSDLPEPSAKICTFKIADEFQGRKLGETLLADSIEYIRKQGCNSCFVEVSPSRHELIGLLKEFGFFELPSAKDKDLALGKILSPNSDSFVPSNPLDFNRKYGPGTRRTENAFVVPIIPDFHSGLFPTAESQQALFDSSYGNAVRKVYVSHSNTKKLRQGDTLLFLKTQQRQAVHAIGVVEATLRTKKIPELLRFAGARTVYSQEQLEDWCRKEVLAIKFRLDEVLDSPLPAKELLQLCGFEGTPQSVTQITSTKGLTWVRSLQGESH